VGSKNNSNLQVGENKSKNKNVRLSENEKHNRNLQSSAVEKTQFYPEDNKTPDLTENHDNG
jgi:hypothetical protein